MAQGFPSNVQVTVHDGPVGRGSKASFCDTYPRGRRAVFSFPPRTSRLELEHDTFVLRRPDAWIKYVASASLHSLGMPPKGFEDLFALWLKQNPKPFLITLLATGIAVDKFDIFGNQARIAADRPPPELQEQRRIRAQVALARIESERR